MFARDFKQGEDYLKKYGSDVIMIFGGMKIKMSPGSAYEDINKEKLPESYTIPELNKTLNFSAEFKKHYKITHRVDLDRLMRGCSILLTNFNGAEKDDNLKNHHQRLFNYFLIKPAPLAQLDLVDALKYFGKIIKLPKNNITGQDYYDASDILNYIYKFWIPGELPF